jgi:type IV pilus assembly protein PilB
MVRRQRIGEILMAAGLIDESQLRTAVSDQQRFGAQLGEALVRRGFLSGEQLMRGLAAQLGVPVARMKGKRIAPEVLELLPADLAVKYGCIPLFTKREGGVEVLYIGMEDPTDLRTLDELTFQIGMQLPPVRRAPRGSGSRSGRTTRLRWCPAPTSRRRAPS